MHKITGQKAAEKHCNTFEAVSGVGVVIVLGDEKVKKQYQLRDFVCGDGATAGVQYGLGRKMELLYRFIESFFVLAGLAFQAYHVYPS